MTTEWPTGSSGFLCEMGNYVGTVCPEVKQLEACSDGGLIPVEETVPLI